MYDRKQSRIFGSRESKYDQIAGETRHPLASQFIVSASLSYHIMSVYLANFPVSAAHDPHHTNINLVHRRFVENHRDIRKISILLINA